MNAELVRWLTEELSRVLKNNGDPKIRQILAILKTIEDNGESVDGDKIAVGDVSHSNGVIIGRNNLQIMLNVFHSREISEEHKAAIEQLHKEALGQVFISYARQDAGYAERLEQDLNRLEIKTWRDTRDLDPSQDFTGEIEYAIRSSSHVVVCLTPDVQRKDSFVRREIAYAASRKKPIIPLMYQGGELPLQISTWTYVDMRKTKGLSQLLKRLNEPAFIQQPEYADNTPLELVEYLNALHEWASQRLEEGVHTLITLAAADTPGAVKKSTSKSSGMIGFNFVVSQASVEQKTESDAPSRSRGSKHFASFSKAFEYYGGRLLLLGDPGAGKTTTLLAFARDAAIDRLNDSSKPVPIIASINRWNHKDAVPYWAKAEQKIVNSEVFDGHSTIYILDGLDELGGDRLADPGRPERKKYDPRLQFMERVQKEIDGSLIVSSRIKDYIDVGQKFELPGAITLKPLTNHQIRRYLVTRKQQALWNALRQDPSLFEMARTPLLLALLVVAFGHKDEADTSEVSLDALTETAIFDRFITRRFLHEQARLPTDRELSYDEQATRDKLGELAQYMWIDSWSPATELDISEIELLLGSDTSSFLDFARHMHFLQYSSSKADEVRFVHLRLRDFCATPFLIDGLAHPDSQIRYASAWALGEIGDSRASDGLAKSLRDNDASVRYAAAVGLGEIGDSRTVPKLVECLGDQDPDVRRSVVDALDQIGDSTAAPYLARSIDDPDIEVREWAAQTLCKLSPETAAQLFLIRLRKAHNQRTRNYYSRLILRCGEIAVPFLLDALQVQDAEFRWEIAWILGQLRSPKAIPSLSRLLHDANDWIRETAERSLRTIGTSEALGAIEKSKSQDD